MYIFPVSFEEEESQQQQHRHPRRSSSWNTNRVLCLRVDLCYPRSLLVVILLVVCVCKSGANKFACNRHKLLELLHGNKLVRTESDNTTRAAWFCLCRCCCRYIYSVVIVIRIHVEQTCEWQPCFSYPLDHSCFVAVPAKNTGTDHKKLWILQFQRRNNEDDLEVHRSVREGNNYCLFDRHISITNPQFHGEINDKQEELGTGKWKWHQRGFDGIWLWGNKPLCSRLPWLQSACHGELSSW